MYVCIFQQVCVSACQDCASHKTDAGVRMNRIQSAISSLQHSERLVEGERQKDTQIIKTDHKSNING